MRLLRNVSRPKSEKEKKIDDILNEINETIDKINRLKVEEGKLINLKNILIGKLLHFSSYNFVRKIFRVSPGMLAEYKRYYYKDLKTKNISIPRINKSNTFKKDTILKEFE